MTRVEAALGIHLRHLSCCGKKALFLSFGSNHQRLQTTSSMHLSCICSLTHPAGVSPSVSQPVDTSIHTSSARNQRDRSPVLMFADHLVAVMESSGQ